LHFYFMSVLHSYRIFVYVRKVSFQILALSSQLSRQDPKSPDIYLSYSAVLKTASRQNTSLVTCTFPSRMAQNATIDTVVESRTSNTACRHEGTLTSPRAVPETVSMGYILWIAFPLPQQSPRSVYSNVGEGSETRPNPAKRWLAWERISV